VVEPAAFFAAASFAACSAAAFAERGAVVCTLSLSWPPPAEGVPDAAGADPAVDRRVAAAAGLVTLAGFVVLGAAAVADPVAGEAEGAMTVRTTRTTQTSFSSFEFAAQAEKLAGAAATGGLTAVYATGFVASADEETAL
jgi:hypothetical protein